MKFLTTIYLNLSKYTLAFCILFCVSCSQLQAQGGSASPYSRYGLGDLQFGGFASEVAMGGISSGISHPYHLNYSNPASYASLRFTSFETAVKSQFMKLQSKSTNGVTNNTTLSYLALGFPIIKSKWGASFGLIPYSDIGYTIKDQEALTNIGRVNYVFEGSGGLNRFYIGTGIAPVKNLSIGINASYLFGSLQRSRRIEFPDQVNYFNTLSYMHTNLHDFYFNYGIQYLLNLKKEQSVTFGLAGALSSKIRSGNDLLTVNYVVSSSGFYSYKDTIEEISDSRGFTKLPATWTGGILYKKGEKWLLGVDYSFQNWSKFESFGSSDSLNDSYRISAGGQFTPDYSSLRFFKRVQYRAGIRYNQTYLKLKDTNLKDYGASLGFGVPLKIKGIPRVIPVITFAVEAGQRGTTNNNLLREQYLRFHFGVTISEEWFLKRKFD